MTLARAPADDLIRSYMRLHCKVDLSFMDGSNQQAESVPSQLQRWKEEWVDGARDRTLGNKLEPFRAKVPHEGNAAKWHRTVTAAC